MKRWDFPAVLLPEVVAASSLVSLTLSWRGKASKLLINDSGGLAEELTRSTACSGATMDKLHTFKKLRKQLAAEYEAEILAVNDLLNSGVESLGGSQTSLNTSTRDAESAIGEARRAMAEDVQNTIRVVMQRYAKNLEDEISELGLLKKDVDTVNVSLSRFDRDWTPEPPIEQIKPGHTAQPATFVEDSPVLNLRNPFQEPSVAPPGKPTAFLDRSTDAGLPTKNGHIKPS